MHKTVLLLLTLASLAAAQTPDAPIVAFQFAVSGDSRNCGDVVMPAIAAKVLKTGARFYWHLGDFRAIYMFDEDMAPPPETGLKLSTLDISTYESTAWPDFIRNQLMPFGTLPVYLAIGNHEAIPPMNRDLYIAQFADWINSDAVRAQRLADAPADHLVKTYYHWIQQGVDFITLDNATYDKFDDAQVTWLRGVLQRAAVSPQVRTVVVGMHAALPGSSAASHSMNNWAQGDKSGREVYQQLWNLQQSSGKKVYVLASHSHFLLQDVYNTPDWKGRVLTGWIVGTAGAVRYRLPPNLPAAILARTDVYGFLLASVMTDGSITFSFQPVTLEELLKVNHGTRADALMKWCVEHNKSMFAPR